jgi:hypothetical protein
MATRQILCARVDQGVTSAQYMGIAADSGGGANWSSTLPDTGSLIRWTSTYRNFSFRHLTAPGASKSFTYTLVKNGTDTAVARP